MVGRADGEEEHWTGLDWEKDQMGIDWTAATGDRGWWMDVGGRVWRVGSWIVWVWVWVRNKRVQANSAGRPGGSLLSLLFSRGPWIFLLRQRRREAKKERRKERKESEDRERYRERGKSWQEDKDDVGY